MILSPIYDEKNKLVKLTQISSIKIGDEKTLFDTTLSLYKGCFFFFYKKYF